MGKFVDELLFVIKFHNVELINRITICQYEQTANEEFAFTYYDSFDIIIKKCLIRIIY
jgi:hypothetical protein